MRANTREPATPVATLSLELDIEIRSVAFTLAYVTSQIAPGTMEHLALLTPHLREFPTALLWYGMLAGLSSRSQLQRVGNGLGQRVVRDVLAAEDFLDRPRCDIAVAELEVLLSGESTSAIRVGATRPTRGGTPSVHQRTGPLASTPAVLAALSSR